VSVRGGQCIVILQHQGQRSEFIQER